MGIPILKALQEEKDKENMDEVSIERKELKEFALDKENLLGQRKRIEERIKRFERKDIDGKIINSLKKLGDVIDAISDMQYALNIIWKRTQQIEEELKQALIMPQSSSHSAP